MTHDEFIVYLRSLITEAGSQAHLARQLGLTPQTLNDALTGHRLPGGKLLTALGFTATVIYIPPKAPRKITRAQPLLKACPLP